jgi:DNA-nicking Smr family endonuclease
MHGSDDSSFSEPIEIPIEDSIDLHTFAPREVKQVVEEYLLMARQRGFREVRIIHGRGVGIQREIVRSLLENHPLVDSFRDARAEEGGWGATWVVLKLAKSGQ